MDVRMETAGASLLARIVGLIVLALLVLLLDLRNEVPGAPGFDLVPAGQAVTLTLDDGNLRFRGRP